jgi:hypothetical protein
MLAKLEENIDTCLADGLPWSARLQQMRSLYSIGNASMWDVLSHVSKKTSCRVYLVFDMKDVDCCEEMPNLIELTLPDLDSMVLYVVPSFVLWEARGETHRKYIGPVKVHEHKFEATQVLYKETGAVLQRRPFTQFVELHLPLNASAKPRRAGR